MLEKLDSINWRELQHAYGEASDVPGLLRAYAAGESFPDDFYGNIWHQGTVYQATAYAVPFLLEILENSKADKVELLVYLKALATGSSYIQAHHVFDSAEEIADADYQKNWQDELHWVHETRLELAKGIPLYLTYLQQGAPQEKMAAAFLLEEFLENKIELSNVTGERLSSETNPHVRAALLMSLSRSSSKQSLHVLEQSLDAFELERYAAASSLVEIQKETTSEKVLRVLLESLLLAEELGEKLAELPRVFSEDELVNEASQRLAMAGNKAIPYFKLALEKLDKELEYYTYYMHDIIDIFFARFFSDKAKFDLATATPAQLEVLNILLPYQPLLHSGFRQLNETLETYAKSKSQS